MHQNVNCGSGGAGGWGAQRVTHKIVKKSVRAANLHTNKD